LLPTLSVGIRTRPIISKFLQKIKNSGPAEQPYAP